MSERRFGKAPLILVPGHLCDARLYAPQIAELAGRAEIAVADVASDDDLGAMAERMLAAAPAWFAVAGLSMGGMVAMEAMARAPERITGAALFDTDPTAARDRERDWRAAQVARARAEGLAAFVDRFVPAFFAHDPAAAARLGPEVRAAMLETPFETYLAQCRALDGRRDMLTALGGCAGPVEIVVGAEDRICPPPLHARLAEALPDARLERLAGVGHLATLEAPEAATAALVRLLERIDPRGRSA